MSRESLLFVINNFFFFSHTTSQHNIHSKQTKHNKTTDVYSLFQKSNQKGEREGDKEKTKQKKNKSFLYIITYIREKTLPSINSRRLGPINLHCCTFTSHYLQEGMDPIYFSTHMWRKPVLCIVFFAAVKPANNILFCIKLIQRPESSLRRHKLGLANNQFVVRRIKPGLHVSID